MHLQSNHSWNAIVPPRIEPAKSTTTFSDSPTPSIPEPCCEPRCLETGRGHATLDWSGGKLPAHPFSPPSKPGFHVARTCSHLHNKIFESSVRVRIIEETDKNIHIVVQLTGRYNWVHNHQDHRYGALQLLRGVEIDLQKGLAGNFHTREVLF